LEQIEKSYRNQNEEEMRKRKHFWKAAAAGSLALLMAVPTLATAESRKKVDRGAPNLECRLEKG
jgi:hypothetical protein